MAKEGSTLKTALIIVGSIIALTGAGWLTWYLIKKKSDADAAAQLKLDKAAKSTAQKAAAIKKATPSQNPIKGQPSGTPTTVQQAALDAAMKKASDALKAAQSGGKSSGSGSGGSGGKSSGGGGGTNKDGSKSQVAPASSVDSFGNPKGSTVNKQGDYIEKDDPTTLYNKAGEVIGDLDPEKGIFVNPKTGEPVATNSGDKFDSYDKTTDNYTCVSDPNNLHSNSGDIIATKDSNGDYVNPNTGMTLGGDDGTGKFEPYQAVDEQTREYQTMDGQWHNVSGEEIAAPSNPDNISYTNQDQNDESMGIDSRNPDGSIDYSDGSTLLPDGTLVDAYGDTIATNVTEYDPNGDGKITYEGGNSETLTEAEVGGTYNTTTGNYEDANGNPIADSDGVPIVAYDGQGNTQDPSGQWYNQSGDPIDESQVDSTDTTYNTPDDTPPEIDPNYWND